MREKKKKNARSLNVDSVVSTNYDTLFEDASRDAGKPCAVLPYQPSRDTARFVLKMHGDIHHVQDIVLTREDYLRYGSIVRPPPVAYAYAHVRVALTVAVVLRAEGRAGRHCAESSNNETLSLCRLQPHRRQLVSPCAQPGAVWCGVVCVSLTAPPRSMKIIDQVRQAMGSANKATQKKSLGTATFLFENHLFSE